MDKNRAVTQARRERGWGIVQLAREAGVGASTIYSIERGEREGPPWIRTCHRIATALDRPLNDLFPDASDA